MNLKDIFESNDPVMIKSLFSFKDESNEMIVAKFNLWARYFAPQYFSSEDAPFHKEMDMNNVKAYRGELTSFVNIQFRGSGKTIRTKLFLAFCISNDLNHSKKYIKVLSQDSNNSKQIVTDIYNLLVQPEVTKLYPEIFRKTNQKREETMSTFTTTTGIKIISDTVGTSQRGAVQEHSRPDLIWFEDIEDRITLRSAVKTKAIFDNMEEARTGLAKGGSCIYTCFSRDTKFVTNQGVKSFIDFNDGDKVTVLTHTGQWKEAIVRNFGKQQLQKIRFKRGKRNNIEVWATLDHNWILKDGCRTSSIKTGDKVLGAPNIFDNFVYEESTPEERLYWAYGYVFGDGTRIKSNGIYKYSMVRLFGKETRFIPRFEELGFTTSTNLSLDGDYYAYTGKYLKTLPDPKKDNPSLIRAFVRGFLDADGAKGRKDRRYSSPFVQMVQTDKHGALDFIRNCFPIAGVFTTYEENIGGQVNISPYDQRNITRHESATRFGLGSNFEDRYSNMQFTAIVTDERKDEEVWCLEVEEDHSFVLDSGISTGNCNYISERGNVHVLVTKPGFNKEVLIVPILKDGLPTWDRFTLAEINQMKEDDDDFTGERMCEPSASKDIVFDRETIDNMEKRAPIRSVAGFEMFRTYDASHRYAIGADVAGGVGLDSSTSVFIDFDMFPAQVVATYHNNEIKPDVFGDELKRQGEYYGEPLLAPEKNNHGHAVIGRLKQIYPVRKLFKTQKKDTRIDRDDEPTEYGWLTTAVSKPKMIFDLVKAVNNGQLVLNCPKLIAEARGYTRNDLMDEEIDPRLTTRHFDLLTAACIAFAMKDHVDIADQEKRRNAEIQRIMENRNFDPFEII